MAAPVGLAVNWPAGGPGGNPRLLVEVTPAGLDRKLAPGGSAGLHHHPNRVFWCRFTVAAREDFAIVAVGGGIGLQPVYHRRARGSGAGLADTPDRLAPRGIALECILDSRFCADL